MHGRSSRENGWGPAVQAPQAVAPAGELPGRRRPTQAAAGPTPAGAPARGKLRADARTLSPPTDPGPLGRSPCPRLFLQGPLPGFCPRITAACDSRCAGGHGVPLSLTDPTADTVGSLPDPPPEVKQGSQLSTGKNNSPDKRTKKTVYSGGRKRNKNHHRSAERTPPTRAPTGFHVRKEKDALVPTWLVYVLASLPLKRPQSSQGVRARESTGWGGGSTHSPPSSKVKHPKTAVPFYQDRAPFGRCRVWP